MCLWRSSQPWRSGMLNGTDRERCQTVCHLYILCRTPQHRLYSCVCSCSRCHHQFHTHSGGMQHLEQNRVLRPTIIPACVMVLSVYRPWASRRFSAHTHTHPGLPRWTPHRSVFLQAGCPSCRPTNSVKALKATREGCRCKTEFAVVDSIHFM